MDNLKAARVRSYVEAQLAFVPFYCADLLGPGGCQHEDLGLQTPLLAARNPVVTTRPGSGPSHSETAYAETRGLGGRSAEPISAALIESLATNHENPPSLPIGERNKELARLQKMARETPDPDTLSGPAKDLSPVKGRRRRGHEKARLPTGLSFLQGFAPKNVGPSRLTIPVGDKGIFRKGRSSSTKPLDRTARSTQHGKPEVTVMSSHPPSTPQGKGADLDRLARQQYASGPIPTITEEVMPRPEQTGGISDNRSMTWDIELENGALPSNSSSLGWDTTVVIDTGRNWNHPEGNRHLVQSVVDPAGEPRSIATRSPDRRTHSSLRVASRFFSTRVPSPSLCGGTSISLTPTPDWEDYSGEETGVSTLNGLIGYPHLDNTWGHSLSQGTDSLSDDYCENCIFVHQEVAQDWSDEQRIDTPFAKSTDSEGGARVPLVGMDCGVLPNQDMPEQGYTFSEGRKLLLGV